VDVKFNEDAERRLSLGFRFSVSIFGPQPPKTENRLPKTSDCSVSIDQSYSISVTMNLGGSGTGVNRAQNRESGFFRSHFRVPFLYNSV
jgi:hypothetical protein